MGNIGKALDYLIEYKRKVATPVVKGELYAGVPVNGERYAPSGDDSPPLPDDIVFFSRNQATGQYVYLGTLDQANAPVAAAGEKRLYARDSNGNIVSTIFLKGDGKLELNGSANTAVAFAALQTAYNELQAAFNAHTHPTAPVGPISPPTGTSSGDISLAEVDKVKLP
jgi:hypothetical protein